MMRIWVSKPSSSSSSSTQSSSRPSPDSFLSDLPQRFRLRYRNRFVPPRPAKEKAIDLNEYVDSSDGGEDINPECYLYEELHVTPVCQEDQSKKNKNKKQNVWKGKGREGEEDTDVTKRKRREEHEFFKTGRDFIHTHRHVEFRKPTKKKQEQVQLQDQLQSHITTTYTPISCSVAPLLTPSTSNPLPSSSSSSTKPLKRRWSAPLHFVTLPLLGRNSTSSEPDPPTTRRPTPPVTLSFDLVSALSDFLGSDFAVSKLGFIPDDKRCLAVCRKLVSPSFSLAKR
ncbi:hypothetical protein EX30DRAFT_369927 [Ascodesmis nigricans]|uniref:Uncharacterized protein n=1 Tax=Ascodesmis nigricans TaxID=341454 RepID=A0A4S2N1M3_9PEZI|nr:hypothetical protein EX30DRAFT_369927 [Ascodesmis nigricans]